MSLINRLSVSNFMNSNGESEHSPWMPRFRMAEINFFGQSTAINARNGCGKTSLARAMLAVLSRNAFLITETHKRMSPKSFKIPTHIRVELIKQPDRMPGQADMLVRQGGRVEGDPYVFGMVGFRNEDISYYFYQGSLEGCPTAMFDGEKHTLLSPESFDGFRKDIPSFKWCRSKDDWLRMLLAHVSNAAMKKMADFQRRGSSDKGISFFDIKVPSGERFDQSFFYDIIAPEIMSGTMDKYGEEDEDEIEKVIFNTVSRVIDAKRNTESQRANLERAKLSSSILANAAMYAEQSRIDLQRYQDKLADIAGVALFLETLVAKNPMIGIPSAELPSGTVGEVAKHLIVGVGETEPMVLASGLSVLLGDEPKDIRRRADRKQISGRNIPETVGNTCHFASVTVQERGHKPESYTIANAHKIIDVSTAFSDDIDKATAHRVLDDAAAWYSEHGERNPYRKQMAEFDYRKDSIRKDIDTIEEEITEHRKQEHELNESQRQMSANEGAFDKLRQCGLFIQDELSSLSETEQQVVMEHQETQRKLHDFNSRKASLSAMKPYWAGFVEQFSDILSPHEVEADRLAERARLRDELNEARKKLVKFRDSLTEASTQIQKLRISAVRVDEKISRFDALMSGQSQFEHLFGDVDPDDLDTRLLKEKLACESHCERLENEIRQLEIEVGHIASFQDNFGSDVSPSDYLEHLNSERDTLMLEQRDVTKNIESQMRKRRDLDNEQIASGDAAREALGLLEQAGIEHSPLHKVIQQIEMPDDRRKAVLSMFSALLFTPVVSSEADGVSAAKVMADSNLPVPIILKSSLEKFCSNPEGGTPRALFIGILTRAVECLLDPNLVEREKDILDRSIVGLNGKLGGVSARLAELDPKSDLIQFIRCAIRAVENKAIEGLVAGKKDLVSKQNRIKELEPLTTKEAISAIRSTQEMIRLGGIKEYEQLQEQKIALANDVSEADDSITQTEQSVTKNEKAIGQLQQDEGTILPSEVSIMLTNAKKFCEDGGVEFAKTEIQDGIQLEKAKSTAESRYGQKVYFRDAQTYLKSRGSGDGETIQDKLQLNRENLEKAEDELGSLKAESKKIGQLKPATEDMMRMLDKCIFGLTSKYRQIAAFTTDIDRSRQIPPEMEKQIALANSLAHADLGVEGHVKNALLSISDTLASIDVDSEIAESRRRKRQLEGDESKMHEFIANTMESDGLAVTEKEILASVNDVHQVQEVIDLHFKLKRICETEEKKLMDFETKERVHRETTADRLAYFIQSASTNLSLFKRMSKKDYGSMRAHFIVDANMIDEAASASLVNDIVDIFEEEDAARRRTNSKGVTVVSNVDFRSGFEAQVRKLVYRRVFTEPSIKYEMEAIRATGQHYLTETLSEGEKSAMTLMWAIRIADFTIVKGSRKATSSLSARAKAKDNAESIMILDGLFSDLSFTDLIKGAMAGIENTRGNFQLIGLIHGQHYDNDFSIFPMLVLGKTNHSSGMGNGWVSFENKSDPSTVDFAYVHSVKGQLEPGIIQ